MRIHVNGEALELTDTITIADLIAQQALSGRRIAVERNGDIVPRSQHAATRLAEGDRLEIVHAIGGG